jgi:hypothetical protein
MLLPIKKVADAAGLETRQTYANIFRGPRDALPISRGHVRYAVRQGSVWVRLIARCGTYMALNRSA